MPRGLPFNIFSLDYLRQAEFRLIAGSERILDSAPLAFQGEVIRPVHVPEHRVIDVVFFEEVGKQGILFFYGEGRVVHKRDKRIPFLAHLFHFAKGKAEALRFAQINGSVVFGEIAAPRASPPARPRNNLVAE